MGQFDNPYTDPGAVAHGERKTSGMAIASLVCSLLGCCPFIPSLLGVIFGGAAVVSIGRDPHKSGKGLAATGIVLGLIGLVVWAVISVVGVKEIIKYGEFVETGPQEILAMGASGDAAGFKARCWGPAASASDEEVTAFFSRLEGRYGALQSVKMDPSKPPQQKFGSPIIPFPYLMTFDNATVDAEIELVFSDPQQGGFLKNIGSITVFDDERGELVYPGDGG